MQPFKCKYLIHLGYQFKNMSHNKEVLMFQKTDLDPFQADFKPQIDTGIVLIAFLDDCSK